MFQTTPDKSVLDSNGRILFFSLPRFISDIAQGTDCFICGAKPNTVPFNNEHVLPDWILKRYRLHDRTIKLPNGQEFRYGEFKIACCTECNAVMGAKFEDLISKCFAMGPEAVSQELKDNGPYRLFCWMSLIFLKTHLKDKYLSFHLDRRKGEMKIGELHSWEELHHIHCVARAFYTHCELTPEVIGSLLVLPAKVRPHFESFDYGDLSFAQTMLLRIDETAIIAVFNDSQAAQSIYYEELGKITGPLSPLQLREIATRLASINIHLIERPRFSSDLNGLTEEYRILGHRPNEWCLANWQNEIQGAIMYNFCKDMVVNTPDREKILGNLKTGRYTFLVDNEGKFIRNHMELAPRH
ncbi:MAG: hypothetical protein ACYDA9_09660 [Terriglobia bacterium]